MRRGSVRRLWLAAVALVTSVLATSELAQATHFYSTRAEQALEALITTSSRCCSITTLYTHAGATIGALPTADGTSGQALVTDGAGVWSFGTPGGLAPSNAQYVTLATNATLTSERVLTGTANQITLTDNGAGSTVVVSIPTAVTLGTITATSLQGIIGNVTPAAGSHTTISASGQITSTVSTGSAPFIVASTTVVANLNASALGGATFAAPGAIGGGTPSTATFTTATATSGLVLTGTTVTGAPTWGSTQTLNTSGNAATATALAADPADCSAGQVALGIVASGVATCTATPTVTSITSPLVVGGSGTTQTVTYKTTTGTGASGADHIFVVGTNGGTESLRLKNDGSINSAKTVFLTALTAASGTPSSICQNAGTGEVTVNAALTCTVSSRRFKNSIRDQDAAWPILAALVPREFKMNDSPAWRIGFIAEEVDQVDPRLIAYDAIGRPHSVRYEDVTSLLTKGMHELNARIQRLEQLLDDAPRFTVTTVR